jgi:PilZ domain
MVLAVSCAPLVGDGLGEPKMGKYDREKRTAQRFQVLGHAQLMAGSAMLNCVIRDLSQNGAKLGVPRQARLPENTGLWLIQGDSRTAVVLKWRDGDHIGVAFTTKKGRPPAIPPGPGSEFLLDV